MRSTHRSRARAAAAAKRRADREELARLDWLRAMETLGGRTFADVRAAAIRGRPADTTPTSKDDIR